MKRAIPHPRAKYSDQAERAWLRICAIRGARSLIARDVGLRWQTVSVWKTVPLEFVFRVAKITRTLPEDLRPDFFHADPLRPSAGQPCCVPKFVIVRKHCRAELTRPQ